MDYKAIAEQLEKIADSDPAVIAEWAAVIRTKYLKNAANAITDLLARAEAAEARAEKAENIASDLCDDFTGFVTGGIHNAAPYCANCSPECVNARGWCNGDNKVCRGFMPKAAVWKEE